MGFDSTLTIYRKHKNFKLGDEDIKKISDLYYKYNMSIWLNGGKTNEELKDDLPYVVDRALDVDGNDFDRKSLSDLRNRYFVDWQPCDLIAEFYFCSSFRALSDELRLGCGNSFKSNEALISAEDASKMVTAIKYLLNQKYDDKIEDILSNKWIEIFGEKYPPYYEKNKSDFSDSLIVEKIDDGSWSIRKDADEQVNESRIEDIKDWEHDYKRLLQGLELALSFCDWDDKVEPVIGYSISY